MKVFPGEPSPLGVSWSGNRANFAVFSTSASRVSLCFDKQEIALTNSDGVWHGAVEGLSPDAVYTYRVDGEAYLLADPYAKRFLDSSNWGDRSTPKLPLWCSVAPLPDFDWQGVESPSIEKEKLVIYELHVRGFTVTSGEENAGTYLGLISKIPYLKALGVNAVNLMPLFTFDETECSWIAEDKRDALLNYWGYNPLSFFVPMSRYAKNPSEAHQELRELVREFHRAGIKVILDVVYNHTGENARYIASWRGLDRASYYLLDADKKDLNYTGCGNTVRTSFLPMRHMILESLRFWVKEMKIDGFRFDLAAILLRDEEGQLVEDPPILREMEQDPLLQQILWIAEPWDATGACFLGEFAKRGKWFEWNGSFRDHVRRFWKGEQQEAAAFATALCGSSPFYGPATPLASVNYFSAHDGLSLRDLVSYEKKHNLANGENNRDGADRNDSWNCGIEGETEDAAIQELRERQMRNFWITLFVSQGIPMITMGDEIGHTRKGNNNPYCQDNELSWFLWEKRREDMCEFVSALIEFRRQHPILCKDQFWSDQEIQWRGIDSDEPDWSDQSSFVACIWQGDEPIFGAFYAGKSKIKVKLPEGRWQMLVNSQESWNSQRLKGEGRICEVEMGMEPCSAVLLKKI